MHYLTLILVVERFDCKAFSKSSTALRYSGLGLEVRMGFTVRRSVGVMVKPSESTPSGNLNLSVIDKLICMRNTVETLHVFRHGDSNTANVIKEALSKALVPYYPLAGRLTDDLQVSCTGEGAWFVQASSDCTLASLNYFDNVPTISADDLVPTNPPGTSPLILIQVTSFTCQGFIVGLVFNHSVLDGLGAGQFMNAVGEYARGFQYPTVAPAWHRERIPSSARLTYAPTHSKLGVSSPSPSPPPPSLMDLQYSCIDISPEEINKAKTNFLEMTGEYCTTFEVAAAAMWRHRTRAISKDGGDIEVKLAFAFNTRKFLDPPLPEGFYGNCIFLSTVVCSSGWLVKASMLEVVKLIREAKARTPAQFKEWLEIEKLDEVDDAFSCPLTYTTFYLSEWGHMGFNRVDYGWGYPMHYFPNQAPLQSRYLPVGTIGLPPTPKNGLRLVSWCVNSEHLPSLNQPIDLS